MLDLESLEKYDSQKMYKIYEKWPEIAKEQYDHNFPKVDFQNISNIIFAGMGGSGTIGDIFSSILSKTDIHVNVVKGYLLPKTVNNNSLVVVTSVSGNTDETLNILESTQKIGCKTIAFSSGGLVREYCKKNNIEYRKLTMIHSPRASLVSFLYAMLKILEPIIPILKKDIIQSIEELEKIKKQISFRNLSNTNQALSVAEWIESIPVIYYPAGLQSAAIRFKNSLQENAKLHAITEDIIEACHNGIVPWVTKTNLKPILLEGSDDYHKTKERWGIIKELFNSTQIEYKEVFSINGNILSKLMCLIYLLDYASIYKAVISKTDPTPVEPIDFVKRSLE